MVFDDTVAIALIKARNLIREEYVVSGLLNGKGCGDPILSMSLLEKCGLATDFHY